MPTNVPQGGFTPEQQASIDQRFGPYSRYGSKYDESMGEYWNTLQNSKAFGGEGYDPVTGDYNQPTTQPDPVVTNNQGYPPPPPPPPPPVGSGTPYTTEWYANRGMTPTMTTRNNPYGSPLADASGVKGQAYFDDLYANRASINQNPNDPRVQELRDMARGAVSGDGPWTPPSGWFDRSPATGFDTTQPLSEEQQAIADRTRTTREAREREQQRARYQGRGGRGGRYGIGQSGVAPSAPGPRPDSPFGPRKPGGVYDDAGSSKAFLGGIEGGYGHPGYGYPGYDIPDIGGPDIGISMSDTPLGPPATAPVEIDPVDYAATDVVSDPAPTYGAIYGPQGKGDPYGPQGKGGGFDFSGMGYGQQPGGYGRGAYAMPGGYGGQQYGGGYGGQQYGGGVPQGKGGGGGKGGMGGGDQYGGRYQDRMGYGG